MYSRNNPNRAFINNQLWRQSTTPRIGIVQELVTRLSSELDHINVDRDVNFGDGFSLDERMREFESEIIRHALYLTNGKQIDAARILGIKNTTLNAKIKRLRLDPSAAKRFRLVQT